MCCGRHQACVAVGTRHVLRQVPGMCCGRHQACVAAGTRHVEHLVRLLGFRSHHMFFSRAACSHQFTTGRISGPNQFINSPIHNVAHQRPQSVHQFTNSPRGASEAPISSSIHQFTIMRIRGPNQFTDSPIHHVAHQRPRSIHNSPIHHRGPDQFTIHQFTTWGIRGLTKSSIHQFTT